MKTISLYLNPVTTILLKNPIQKWLVASILFSFLLSVARIIYSGSFHFVWLNWNLFLAFIPYMITCSLEFNDRWKKNSFRFILAFLGWILFIPNSFYIITDLFHLRWFEGVPIWYDLALLLSFAWNGLILGIVSVRQMEKIIEEKLGVRNELFFVYPVMWLNALGVYVGRFLRFNSWDVISNPFQLIADISNILIHPFQNKYAWGMILCFSLLMTLMYVTVKKLNRVFI